MNKALLEQAKQIARQNTPEKIQEAMELIENYLKTNKHDTEAWLLLATLECNPPFEIPDRVIHCTQNILAYDPRNAYASLFLAFAHYYLMGWIDDKTYEQLCTAHDSDPEVMAMIELAKAEYWEHKNQNEYEKALLKSISYSTNQYKNLAYLGKLYLEQGKIEEGDALIEQAKKNLISSNNHDDPTNMQYLFDWYYKGVESPQNPD